MPIEALITLRSIIIALDMATPLARGSAVGRVKRTTRERRLARFTHPTQLAAGQELRPSGESSQKRQ